ncbi:MAG: 6-carboxytetrahydropterin synthase [Gemmatimonadetes bacterium]|nr:6-carboxytetrahydropterin synthase [Gemmatimonadota bacterium]
MASKILPVAARFRPAPPRGAGLFFAFTPAPWARVATVRVTRRLHFSAAHRLHNPALSDEENRRIFGPCNHPNWHGHNYELDVTVEGQPDPDTGYVVDLGLLRDAAEAVVAELDHRNLNLDVPWLRGVIPSTENLVVALWHRIAPVVPSGRLVKLTLWETPRNSAEYSGG